MQFLDRIPYTISNQVVFSMRSHVYSAFMFLAEHLLSGIELLNEQTETMVVNSSRNKIRVDLPNLAFQSTEARERYILVEDDFIILE